MPVPAPTAPSTKMVMNKPPEIAPSPPVPAPIAPAAAPATIPSAGVANRVLFSAGVTELPEDARRDLEALAQKLSANTALKLQLVAYASAAAGEENQARRTSLSRAIAVRAFLIEHGVASGRMDVRALGNRNSSSGDPADRVDIVVLDH